VAGLVSRLPFPFSGRTTAASASFALSDIQYDFAIGGMPFLTAIDDEHPMTIAGAEQRKEQFDNQQIPGEQSLANWWLRSQSTFIGGAGVLYQDPSVDNQYAIRFADSVGVNPWVNGELSLLRRTTQRIADGSANLHHLVGYNDGSDRVWSAVGATLKSDDGSATTTITWGGAGIIRSLTSDGTNYYAADNVGIYKGAGAGAGALAWNTGSTAVTVGWVKGRLMAGVDNKLYELTTGGPALPAANFTHLNTSWQWTAFAEGTNAIYAAGYAGSQSDIYKLVLDTSGAVPTLAAGGTQAAQLPRGEVVLALTSYLGTFVGIGTHPFKPGLGLGRLTELGERANRGGGGQHLAIIVGRFGADLVEPLDLAQGVGRPTGLDQHSCQIDARTDKVRIFGERQGDQLLHHCDRFVVTAESDQRPRRFVDHPHAEPVAGHDRCNIPGEGLEQRQRFRLASDAPEV
jgi:hypothetical protein